MRPALGRDDPRDSDVAKALVRSAPARNTNAVVRAVSRLAPGAEPRRPGLLWRTHPTHAKCGRGGWSMHTKAGAEPGAIEPRWTRERVLAALRQEDPQLAG